MGRCDIDNRDGTGEINFAKDRESPTEMEAMVQVRAVTPRTGGRERDVAERAPEDPTRAREEALPPPPPPPQNVNFLK